MLPNEPQVPKCVLLKHESKNLFHINLEFVKANFTKRTVGGILSSLRGILRYISVTILYFIIVFHKDLCKIYCFPYLVMLYKFRDLLKLWFVLLDTGLCAFNIFLWWYNWRNVHWIMHINILILNWSVCFITFITWVNIEDESAFCQACFIIRASWCIIEAGRYWTWLYGDSTSSRAFHVFIFSFKNNFPTRFCWD